MRAERQTLRRRRRASLIARLVGDGVVVAVVTRTRRPKTYES
jgi:hypothetical protein